MNTQEPEIGSQQNKRTSMMFYNNSHKLSELYASDFVAYAVPNLGK